jgi:hypothetical protein
LYCFENGGNEDATVAHTHRAVEVPTTLSFFLLCSETILFRLDALLVFVSADLVLLESLTQDHVSAHAEMAHESFHVVPYCVIVPPSFEELSVRHEQFSGYLIAETFNGVCLVR